MKYLTATEAKILTDKNKNYNYQLEEIQRRIKSAAYKGRFEIIYHKQNEHGSDAIWLFKKDLEILESLGFKIRDQQISLGNPDTICYCSISWNKA